MDTPLRPTSGHSAACHEWATIPKKRPLAAAEAEGGADGATAAVGRPVSEEVCPPIIHRIFLPSLSDADPMQSFLNLL